MAEQPQFQVRAQRASHQSPSAHAHTRNQKINLSLALPPCSSQSSTASPPSSRSRQYLRPVRSSSRSGATSSSSTTPRTRSRLSSSTTARSGATTRSTGSCRRRLSTPCCKSKCPRPRERGGGRTRNGAAAKATFEKYARGQAAAASGGKHHLPYGTFVLNNRSSIHTSTLTTSLSLSLPTHPYTNHHPSPQFRVQRSRRVGRSLLPHPRPSPMVVPLVPRVRPVLLGRVPQSRGRRRNAVRASLRRGR